MNPRDIAGVTRDWLDGRAPVVESITADAPDLTRAIHYPTMATAPGAEHVWAGEHGDINLITALPRATAPGLQVKVDGEWVDAVAPAGQVRGEAPVDLRPHQAVQLQVPPVCALGRGGEAQAPGDFLITQALRHHLQDVDFPRRQC